MQEELKQIKTEGLTDLETVSDLRELESLRIKYFGRRGLLSTVMRGMGKLSKEERPVIGKLANEIRASLEEAFDQVERTLNQQAREGQLAAEAVDITLPGRPPQLGKKHPVTQTFDRIQEIFRGMGFQVAEGPEVEHEYYNFDALNTPAEHPARDSHDTFYITDTLTAADTYLTSSSPLHGKTEASDTNNRPGASVSLRFRCLPHTDVPSSRRVVGCQASYLQRVEGCIIRLRATDVRRGNADTLPSPLLPVHRAECGGRYLLHNLPRRRVSPLFRHWLA